MSTEPDHPATQADDGASVSNLPSTGDTWDARAKNRAVLLDKDGTVYTRYAVLDSLSSSYSMFKYFYDILAPKGVSVHDLLERREIDALIFLETVFLVSYSYLACKYENEKDNELKQQISNSWPFFRDVMKGLKNAYKGWRSTLLSYGMLSHSNPGFLITIPGVLLGIIAARNRYQLRAIYESRKIKMKANAELLAQIKEYSDLKPINREAYLNKSPDVDKESAKLQIKYQEDEERYRAYAGAAAGGLIDGLYLYVGVMTLAVLTAEVFCTLFVLSLIYAFTCVVTRLFEEYDYQLKLFITQSECKLHLIVKVIQNRHSLYSKLLRKEHRTPEEEIEFKQLETELLDLVDELGQARNTLEQQLTRSYFEAFFLGIKNGLYAYSALTSLIFVVGLISLLASVPCPPLFLMATVPMGMVFIIGFTLHSLHANYQFLNHSDRKKSCPYDNIKTALGRQKEFRFSLLATPNFLHSVEDATKIEATTVYYYPEWFEVARSFFSGLTKGQKFVDFAGTDFQEPDDNGVYQDPPLLMAFGLIVALGFGVVLAKRALAKGFGRPPPGQLTEDKKPEVEKGRSDSPETTPVEVIRIPSAETTAVRVSSSNDTLFSQSRRVQRSQSSVTLSSTTLAYAPV